MNSFCFTELNYSILSVASILIKCMKPALKGSSFVKRLFSLTISRKDFSKMSIFPRVMLHTDWRLLLLLNCIMKNQSV